MIKGETKTGFKFEFDEKRMDDMEFIEMLANIENDVTMLPKVLNTILGVEQKQKLYDHVREKDGRVPTEAVNNALEEMFDAAGDQVKNS